MIAYKWTITPRANQLLIELEAIKMVFNNLVVKPHLELNLRRQSLLKSAVFSARVEGYSDTMYSQKKESQDLLSAYNFVYSKKAPKNLSLSLIRRFHRLVLKNKSSGNWRSEPWAIFSLSGAVIYLAPPAPEISQLMDEYVEYLVNLNDHPAVIAAFAQFIFEKIHPFADGNGRVGRLISSFLLEKGGFGFRGLAPFEEYIEEHRSSYYFNLESGGNCTGFIEFFLEALVFQLKNDIGTLGENRHELPEDSLLPRRREILDIIRDHPFCTFDFIRRRFTAVNPKTLHYDINQLTKAGFIRKLGKTRGASYQAVQ
ncbi:Fic family protein [Candidatus Collierbacteria bacterium]|nr:Fic family protein [Candidatus Collierbacteria bacterium]